MPCIETVFSGFIFLDEITTRLSFGCSFTSLLLEITSSKSIVLTSFTNPC